MIVRMSKIMVMGPVELLMEVLAHIQQLGILHVDTDCVQEEALAPCSTFPQLMDKESILQHQLLEKLRRKIDELLYYLSANIPQNQKESYLIDVESLVILLPLHLQEVKKRREMTDKLLHQVAACDEYQIFVDTLADIGGAENQNEVECIGVRLNSMNDIEKVQEYVEQECKKNAAFDLAKAEEGKATIGIITVRSADADTVRKGLKVRGFNTYDAPEGMENVSPLFGNSKFEMILREKKKEMERIKSEESEFAKRWYWAYLRTKEWLDSRLSLFNVRAAVIKTRMCFFIYGWLPAKDFLILEENLRKTFNGKVVTEESELVEQDFSRIPTVLKNSVYFEPFELFTRLLPMPPYVSFDITPFIGIFFPVFFGMMLGDIGYGVILLGCSIWLVKKYTQRKSLQDAGKILFICSLYTIVFGVLYGELLGTVGNLYLGLKPVLIDRQESVVPMLYFAIAAGVVHVIIGLVLGIIVSLRRKMKKEALFKLANILIILCLCVLIVSHFTQSMVQVQKPLLLAICVVTPMLLLVGGLMAPLELLKNIGNIISYARIMAVGLTSVLLAYVANYMAGRIGSVWAGIMVAVLLHAFNLLLGVFAPTIHSLRLHYVEFLSKFMEPGGREFKPLGRK